MVFGRAVFDFIGKGRGSRVWERRCADNKKPAKGGRMVGFPQKKTRMPCSAAGKGNLPALPAEQKDDKIKILIGCAGEQKRAAV